ncbi:MAG: caspase family protein [Bacteroidia bacterium]|nr:caspase family protein [Bacteroidia bacterium]
MKKFLSIYFVLTCSFFYAQSIKLIKTLSIGSESIKNISISGHCKYIGASTVSKVKIWNLASGKEFDIASTKDLVHFGNSTGLVLTNSYSNIKIVDVSTGKLNLELEGKQEIMNDAKFSTGLSFIFTIGESGKVHMWSSKDGSLINSISASESALTKLSVSYSSKYLAVADINKTIYLIDVPNAAVIKTITLEEDIKQLHFSRDEELIYFVTDDNKLYSNKVFERDVDNLYITKAKCIDISTDGKIMALGNMDNGISFVTLSNKPISKTENGTASITDISWSKDGKLICGSYANGKVNLFDVSGFNLPPTDFYLKNFIPKLSISEVGLIDENQNKVTELNEKAKLAISLTNSGKIELTDLLIQVLPLSGNIKYSTKDTIAIGRIEPSESAKVIVPLTKVVSSTRESLKLIVRDRNNKVYGDTIKFNKNFEFQGSTGLSLNEHSIISDNNKIQKGKQFKLKVTFINKGKTAVSNIRASLLLPKNITVYEDKKLAIATLNSEEANSLEFGLITSENYGSNTIPLKIHVYTNAGAEDFPLVLNIDNNDVAVVTHETNTNQNTNSGGDEKLMRGSADPMKGINMSNASKELKPGKYYALIIGIDNYKGSWAALKNAVNDAKAVESMLKTKYKFESIKALYNEQATRTQIITQLEWLSDNIKENDNLLIYYSGHGEYKKQLNKGFWVPCDATTTSTSQFISNSDLQTFLGGIKSKHTLLISDACFSGDIFRGNTVSVPFENSEKYYTNIYEKISRQAISSGGLEPVMDGGKDGHSVFAYYLLKTLNANSSKYFDSSQLFEQIKIPVINNSEQTPIFNSIKSTGDEGGHFIFIKK